jgi:hypothetical protein
MARHVCFFDDEGTATCIKEDADEVIVTCETCDCNPFPGRIVPSDRILRAGFDPFV